MVIAEDHICRCGHARKRHIGGNSRDGLDEVEGCLMRSNTRGGSFCPCEEYGEPEPGTVEDLAGW